MWYPLKFEPLYRETIWGGRKIAGYYGKSCGRHPVGESWELFDRSVIRNGSYAGQTLAELSHRVGAPLVGNVVWREHGAHFPLLFKFIDAADKLSVQVHPEDAYAHQLGYPSGKDEMWYIIDAPPWASLVYGIKPDCSRSRLEAAIAGGCLENALVNIPVMAGDFLYIPAGTVHALTAGLFVAEVQQNCDITFRLHDWGRVGSDGFPRLLHIHEALEAIHYGGGSQRPVVERYSRAGAVIHTGPSVKGFRTEHVELDGALDSATHHDSFAVLMILSGGGTLHYREGEEPLLPGETVLLPAALGDYLIEGNLSLLHTYRTDKGQQCD